MMNSKKFQVLDMGPGEKPYKPSQKEKVTSVDFNKKFKPTVIHDLTKFPYPFGSNSFDKIMASHIVEHIPNTLKFMEEIFRISKPNAIVIIRTPHYSSRGAWINPTHYKAFSIGTFDYFNPKIDQPYGNCSFKVMKKEFHYLRRDVKHHPISRFFDGLFSSLANLNQNICERIWCYWVGGFSEIYLELKVEK
jgi:SAM-dependent methyltransferase